MALSLLLQNLFTLHSVEYLLYLAGLLFLLFVALQLAGMRPMRSWKATWQKMRESFKSSRFDWRAVAVQTRRLAIEASARQAFAQLRLVGPQLLILCAVFYGGYLYHDSREFHDTYVLTNAVVDAQNGDYVTYHFEDDPTREPYTLNFSCSHYKPYFKPHQIIAKMTYARKNDCESLDGPQYVLKLRRINGVPILEGE